MRSGNHGVPTTIEWLNDVLPSGCRVGIDPFLFSSDAAEELKNAISDKNHELVLIRDLNLVDEIWGESRPEPPKEPTRVHDIKYAGVDVPSKLSFVRSQLAENGCDTVVISMLDEVAWLLNMRGSDVPHSPVFYSYLIVEMSTATLFVNSSKVSEEVLEHLKKAGVNLKPYEAILSDVERLAEKGANLWLDSSSVNAAIVSVFRSGCARYLKKRGKTGRQTGKESSSDEPTTTSHGVQNSAVNGLYQVSPVTLAKSIKNEAETVGMKNSHLRDAAALAEFWCWLEEVISKSL
jgi:Xaa-Pro aminopeptidase